MRRRLTSTLGVALWLVGCGGDPPGDGGTAGTTGDPSTTAEPTAGTSRGPAGSLTEDPATADSTGAAPGTTDATTGPAPDPSSARHTPRPLGSTAAPQGYFEYLPPGYDQDAGAHPLLVYLHGIGANGDGDGELSRVLANGPARLVASDQWPAERPFVVLSPQHPGDGCPPAAEVQAFLDYAIGAYAVEPERIYLTGLSCGAIGAWDYLSAFGSSQIAAAVLIAGDGRGAFAAAGCELGQVPIWGFHGDADDVVEPAGTIEPLMSLMACAPPPDVALTVYPGVGHDSWSRTYDLSAGHDIYAWLLER